MMVGNKSHGLVSVCLFTHKSEHREESIPDKIYDASAVNIIDKEFINSHYEA